MTSLFIKVLSLKKKLKIIQYTLYHKLDYNFIMSLGFDSTLFFIVSNIELKVVVC